MKKSLNLKPLIGSRSENISKNFLKIYLNQSITNKDAKPGTIVPTQPDVTILTAYIIVSFALHSL
jgi:hypothetical protein